MLFLLILFISTYVQYTLPWWSVGIAPLALAFWRARSGRHAFWSGFGALALVWGGLALIRTDELADRMAAVFNLPGSIWLVVITAFVGGLLGGLSAWTGYWFRRALLPQRAPKKVETSA